jgi:hypothetical protein
VRGKIQKYLVKNAKLTSSIDGKLERVEQKSTDRASMTGELNGPCSSAIETEIWTGYHAHA